MSGQGTRYKAAGYTDPKPMIPVSGVPMISRLLRNFPESWPAHFVMAENHQQTLLPEWLKKKCPRGTQDYVAVHSYGPGHAILEGLKSIPEDEAVFVSYCDYGMVWDSYQFESFVRSTGCDACIVSYRGFHAHYLSPVTYAYSRIKNGRVVEVKEKGSFTSDRESEFASSGGYYFRTAKMLREAIDYQKSHQIKFNEEYYTSLTVQSLLQKNPESDVRVFEIPGFFQWGTPEDLKKFEFWEKSYRYALRYRGCSLEVAQVLMPMAGQGSRFKSLFSLPKPLISIQGKPMFSQALATLPQAQHTVAVVLESIQDQLLEWKKENAHCQFISLKETPSGQALSVQAGISSLIPEKELIVSSCDHGIVLDPKIWEKFRLNPDCDAAIFTVKGYPGADRNPGSFAYVIPESEQDLSLVREVSVKVPVSGIPSQDHLLVGTFWFKNSKILDLGIEEVKSKNIRVNGELYLDSVFECLIKKGFRVKMIPLDGYLCWGDPDSLAEALYWEEIFSGCLMVKRPRFPEMN